MNDAQKQLLDRAQKGAFQFAQLIQGKDKENKLKDSVISVQSSDIDHFIANNNKQVKTIEKQDLTIKILKYVVGIETTVLVLLAIFK